MDLRAKWVLVVDDDDDCRETVVDILNESGYPARGASGGAAALEILRTATPSLVLSDLFMIGMSGQDLLKTARQQKLSIPPFVFVTGADSSMLEDISGAVLHKPFDTDRLLGLVAHYCAS